MIDSPVLSVAPRLEILTSAQIEKIYEATLTCLARTGAHIHNATARGLLAQAGASVDGVHVRFPERIILDAVAAAPRGFKLWGRDGRPNLDVRQGNVYYGPGPTCTYFIDPDDGSRRRARRGDPGRVAHVCDALANVDYVMGLALIDDAPPGMAAAYEFAEMVANTGKPVLAWAQGPEDLAAIYDIAVAVAGSADALRRQPFFGLFATCQSPNVHTDAEIANGLWAAERGIPLIYVGGACAGVSSPVTGAATLVVSLAGILSGLAAFTLANPGAPLCLGAVSTAMDLRTAGTTYGSPEMGLYSAAMSDILRWLGLPFMGTAGATESKALDVQAAIECSVQVLTSGLSGATLIHDVGFLECAETGSLECLVMNDEIIAMTRRMLRGVCVDDATLALDLIDRIGPCGEYASQLETARQCRAEIWNPKLMDRSRFPNWQAAGSKTANDRIAERVRTILTRHRPPALSTATLAAIEQRLPGALSAGVRSDESAVAAQ